MEDNTIPSTSQKLSAPPIPLSSESSKPKLNFVKLLIIAGIVVTLGVSGIAGFAYFKQKSTNDSVVPPQPPTVTSSPDHTANFDLIRTNWKTYRNDEFGFEFQYPQRLSFNPNFSSGTLIPGIYGEKEEHQFTFGDPKTYQYEEHYFIAGQDTGYRFDGFYVFIMDTPQQTLDQFVTEYVKTIVIDDGPRKFEPKSTPVTINGVSGFNISVDTDFPVNLYLFQLPDNKLLVFNKMNSKPDSFTREFDQILSTFKFFESKIDSPEWVSYINTIDGYTFNTPVHGQLVH